MFQLTLLKNKPSSKCASVMQLIHLMKIGKVINVQQWPIHQRIMCYFMLTAFSVNVIRHSKYTHVIDMMLDLHDLCIHASFVAAD